MISLRSFKNSDAKALKENGYSELDLDEITEMIAAWQTRQHAGKYFEVFAICQGEGIIGSASLYEHSKSVASLGIDIFENFRRQGCALRTIELARKIAKSKGYKILLNQVRVDNTASIALCQKAGMGSDYYTYKNQKGHDVYLFIDLLL